MVNLEYQLQDKQTIKTFKKLSKVETSLRILVNYWVNEGKVYENKGSSFTDGMYLIELYECKDEKPYDNAKVNAINTIEFRLFFSERKMIKTSTETDLDSVLLMLSLDNVIIDHKVYKRLSLEFDEDRQTYVYYLNG